MYRISKRIISMLLVISFLLSMGLVAGATTSGTATLVTDVSSLSAGDQIIIVAADYDYALSTTQNTNNRGQAAVTKSGSTVSYGSDVQVITLETGTVDGTFGFNVGDAGYLYAASSSGNYLKSTTTLSDNASWAITIDASTGGATITASGTYTNN
ncbi:MAG: hypothetical protein IJW45_00145, partial [Oscillospiraceae bacterium]|nr:hypothetical protein [Oscillospiraceae bacterium]